MPGSFFNLDRHSGFLPWQASCLSLLGSRCLLDLVSAAGRVSFWTLGSEIRSALKLFPRMEDYLSHVLFGFVDCSGHFSRLLLNLYARSGLNSLSLHLQLLLP